MDSFRFIPVKPYAVYGFTWRLTGGELSLGIGHAIEAWGRFRGALRITGRRVGDVRLLKTSSRLLFTGLAGPYASS